METLYELHVRSTRDVPKTFRLRESMTVGRKPTLND